MSYANLASAVTELKEVISVTGRDELLKQAITSTADNVSERSRVLQMVMDIVDGGTSTKDIVLNLREFESDSSVDISEIVSIIYDANDGDLAAGVVDLITDSQTNNSPDSPSKSNPQISLIQVHPADITPGSRLADACSLLMNSVPSYEWSRSVPVLNVTLLVSRPAVDEQGKVTAMSLGRFLVGGATVDGAERKIIESAEIGDENASSLSATGMEIFTSPQTLVNANEDRGEGGSSVRYAPVIDVFRPFMSLKKLELSIASMGAGAVPYKHGKLHVTLHYRS